MSSHIIDQDDHLQPVFHDQTTLPPIPRELAIVLEQPQQSTTTYPDKTPTEALDMHHSHTTTRSTAPRRSIMSRFRRNPHRAARTTQTTTTTTRTTKVHNGGVGTTRAPVHHHKRKVSLGDKISGAMLKLKGTLTHKPAVKAAGTRRMHGTDGRGARHVY